VNCTLWMQQSHCSTWKKRVFTIVLSPCMRSNMAMLERVHGDHGVLTKTRHGWTGRQHCLQSSVGPTALLSQQCGGTCRLCTGYSLAKQPEAQT